MLDRHKRHRGRDVALDEEVANGSVLSRISPRKAAASQEAQSEYQPRMNKRPTDIISFVDANAHAFSQTSPIGG
ncbi:hypothetical protein NKJ28_31110 [Mesorhizobium sp. M0145]|uniref:hypothetical protein n=1 Tax=Mesorhizobium sp. M0145 TaxID=2956895 RepID=UPI00333638BE